MNTFSPAILKEHLLQDTELMEQVRSIKYKPGIDYRLLALARACPEFLRGLREGMEKADARSPEADFRAWKRARRASRRRKRLLSSRSRLR